MKEFWQEFAQKTFGKNAKETGAFDLISALALVQKCFIRDNLILPTLASGLDQFQSTFSNFPKLIIYSLITDYS